MTKTPSIGFVAIGRNEGDRFKRCLLSLKKEAARIVYVDSGSADDSVAFAKGEGVEVVALDRAAPFTAARARNAGFDALARTWPDTDYVMFIDGDCELAPGFTGAAVAALVANPSYGAVTGRCRERFPDATIYNRLCDMEWDGPLGEIKACGGIFMVRADGFRAIGGFNPAVIAAEDDDFCIRLRGTGAKIVRLDHDMCFHDADIHRFGQWWRRMTRAGHAFAQVGDLHPGYFLAERRRAWFWGLILPVAALVAAPFTYGLSLALLLLYPVSLWRTRRGLIARGAAPEHATLAAKFLTLSKFPAVAGMLDYKRKKLTGRHIGIVEYK
ncbi:glycosyltransferase [Marinicaulis aureus]|uniref:Glycosyltransferase n=1 Tax=Hyphococcus aureus TaxID=2666033 RepID=A0ABW1KZK8_9PROT